MKKSEEQRKKEQVIRATRWRRENARCVSIQLNNFYDDDIIKHLDSKENKQRYIISLIRKDIEREHDEAVRAAIYRRKAI